VKGVGWQVLRKLRGLAQEQIGLKLYVSFYWAPISFDEK